MVRDEVLPWRAVYIRWVHKLFRAYNYVQLLFIDRVRQICEEKLLVEKAHHATAVIPVFLV